jgi:GNAT superfamily N-acetyltransferase
VSEALFSRDRYELPPCNLRRLTAGDAERLAAALAAIDPWRTLGYRATVLEAYLRNADPALARFAIVAREALAGVVCLRFPWLRGPQLELIALLDGFRGRGLGAAVMNWAEAEAFHSAANIWALVSSFNAGARRFYRTRGFVEIGVIPELLGAGRDEILLRKQRPISTV